MEKDKQVIHLAEGVKEVVIRHGDAAPIREIQKVNLFGTLDAPRKFIEKRKDLHNKEGVNVLFSRTDRKIYLRVDEKDYFGSEVVGTLDYNPEFVAFGINNSNKTYTIKELQTFLKMRKYFFADKDQNMTIVANLGKFKATVDATLVKEQDNRGNKKESFDVSIKTDLVMSFVLNIPIYKGQPANKILVEVGFDVRDSGVTLWLESAECKETELSLRDKLIDNEIKHFSDYVVIEK